MISINEHTKIGTIIKHHPDALEAIISISPKFEKLRNPILRKLMAGRADIAMASKMSGFNADTFYQKLKPLGFKIDEQAKLVAEEKKIIPGFMKSIKKEDIIELDVRPLISSGKDPLSLITDTIKILKAGQVLKIINSFEPIPLIKLLEKQGFEVYADVINDDLVETYFYKKNDVTAKTISPVIDAANGWKAVLERFEGKLQTIDVRQLEMPLPMITILESLDKLPQGQALFVHHKRIPVFLLPELAERKFDYRINEISDGDVQLLIFKA
jgi:uncharacterized protein (DUF2249 family)